MRGGKKRVGVGVGRWRMKEEGRKKTERRAGELSENNLPQGHGLIGGWPIDRKLQRNAVCVAVTSIPRLYRSTQCSTGLLVPLMGFDLQVGIKPPFP